MKHGNKQQILKNIIQEKLEIEDVSIERSHGVGSINNTSPRTIIVKFFSFKGKQIILSAVKSWKDKIFTSTKTSLKRR